ncbi:alpha/beta hydrolase [Granulosicoccus sp. 3-233]|uniref:alpha/beta hydrolase n=1 Tax=Granulosicoccus sp. 3-233 TaxID=3417969 RepID=UPI003D33E2E5
MSRRITLLVFLFCLVAAARADDDLLAGFPAPQQDFQAHIEEVRRYLLETQLPERRASDVEYNIPFEMPASSDVPHRGRYLLIHGLNDSPTVWRDMARELAQRGYDVRAILLPGHGNTPEAQLEVTYRMWLDAARLQLELWRQGDEPFFIGGFSLGGVIATILAIEYEGIDGLLLFSPAYYSTRNSLLRWASLVSHVKPWVFGGMIIEDNPSKYNSIPINAAAQYYKSTRYLHDIWGSKKLDMPVLMVASMDDSVVSVQRVRRIFRQRFSSPRKRLLLYGNGDVQAADGEVVRKSAYPEYRILNQAHMSVLVAPDNPFYGARGKQLVCNGNEWPVFSACLYYQKDDRWRGAEGTASPDKVPMARTTFNPDFDFIMQQYDEVFAIDR